MPEQISWKEFLKKIKIGDTIMVKGEDGTVQELQYDGFTEQDGILDIVLQPLSLEWIENEKL